MKTRFAPSPTGFMHLGNIYSALQCQRWASENDAQFILRIEDIDFTRCKPEFSTAIIDDLTWMGLKFNEEVSFQNQRLPLYQQALDQLIAMDVLYPCFCTRKQVNENTMNAHSSQLDTYPKTCLFLNKNERAPGDVNQGYAWRLDSQKVQQLLGDNLFWMDVKQNKHAFHVTQDIGDVIIGRKDIQFSYHLAVVVDDAEQEITHIIRGEDLRSSTPVHKVLQLLLGYESPLYIHHALIENKQGIRLAKSKASPTLKSLRNEGLNQQAILNCIKKPY